MSLKTSNIIVAFLVLLAVIIIPVIYLMVGGGFVVKNDLYFYLIVGVVGSLSWIAWGIRRAYSIKYKPFLGDHSEPVSVVMPIWHEHPGTFLSSVDSVVANLRPDDELICVFDQAETDCLAVKDYYRLSGTEIIATEPGKRHALVQGIKAAKNDVVVLCDSDVIWQPDLITEILKPLYNLPDPHVAPDLHAIQVLQQLLVPGINEIGKDVQIAPLKIDAQLDTRNECQTQGPGGLSRLAQAFHGIVIRQRGGLQTGGGTVANHIFGRQPSVGMVGVKV